MDTTLLFCLVFASQLLWISVVMPLRIATRDRAMRESCPPTTHPLLYALPPDYYVSTRHRFLGLNLGIAALGMCVILALLAGTRLLGWDGRIITPFSASGEWDAAIVVPFVLLQTLPYVYLSIRGQAHVRALAAQSPPRRRTATLQRRRLTDYLSPMMLATSALVYVAFIAFAFYYRRHGFVWFTSWGNIAGVTFINLMMIGGVLILLNTRRRDHFQAQEDRSEAIRIVATAAWLTTVVYPVLIATQLVLKVNLSEAYEPVMSSLFAQMTSGLVLWTTFVRRPRSFNLDVYRGETA